MDIIANIEKVHTTEMGFVRIQRNLRMPEKDVVEWCKEKILDPHSMITKKGKNWYITTDYAVITVNAFSYTIITAHPLPKNSGVYKKN